MATHVLDTVFKDMQTLVETFVIKYERKAKKFDTLENIRESDRYLAAVDKQDTFHTYQTFDEEAIIQAGITDPILIQRYKKDKYLIPNDRRARVVDGQRKIIINNYVETNNYYRMLNGLPDIEDTKKSFIYLSREDADPLQLDISVPIHEQRLDDLRALETKGIIRKFIQMYPDKKYLNYMGEKRIDLVRARKAKNFSILYITKNISENLFEEFNNLYEQCREYFLTVIYIKEFGQRYYLYDNFIALLIFYMTIQRIIVNTFKYGIERDFYDLGSIQMLFDAYNVPFIEELPMEYQRILIRNLNNLLRYKSTDKVLYEICAMLGFERIKIFKYFLIKEHKLDNNGVPIFQKKTEWDETIGEYVEVDDFDAMFNIYFQTVELKERNRALALSDSLSRLEYGQVVTDDPYWWDDDRELREFIHKSDFNYVETKYLNMNIMYKLTEMLFEVIYVFRMMIDKKTEVGNYLMELPKLFDKKQNKLFDVIMFLCALISRKNNMVGNVISTPSKTLSILGFNFKADFATIRNDIENNPRTYDPILLRYLSDLRIDDPSEINTLFGNIRNMNDHIVEKIRTTQDIKVYHAYKKLYQALMVTSHTEALLTKSNGEIADTFLDYLQDADLILADFVVTSEHDKLSEYIEHVLYRINETIKDLQYLYILNDSNNVLLNAAITLIRFFKSYTTDLSSFNILYLMDSPYWNTLKYVPKIQTMSKDLHHSELGSFMKPYASNIRGVGATVTKEDGMPLRDTLRIIREE